MKRCRLFAFRTSTDVAIFYVNRDGNGDDEVRLEVRVMITTVTTNSLVFAPHFRNGSQPWPCELLSTQLHLQLLTRPGWNCERCPTIPHLPG